MKCERHSWDTNDKEWCWRCEELTIEENKKKYENKFCNNGLQRDSRDSEINSISFREEEANR